MTQAVSLSRTPSNDFLDSRLGRSKVGIHGILDQWSLGRATGESRQNP